jgi:hypothetical protein
MACALTQGYNLDCRNSIAGIKEVHIIEWDSIATITAAAGVITAMTKTTGKKFWKYSLIKQTGSAEEAIQANEENGTVHVQQSIKFPTAKLQAAVRNEIMLLAQNRLAMVVVDNNGIGWLYGEKNAMLMSTGAKAMTGVKFGDRNGYEFDFAGFEPVLAQQVDASTLLTLQTAGV